MTRRPRANWVTLLFKAVKAFVSFQSATQKFVNALESGDSS